MEKSPDSVGGKGGTRGGKVSQRGRGDMGHPQKLGLLNSQLNRRAQEGNEGVSQEKGGFSSFIVKLSGPYYTGARNLTYRRRRAPKENASRNGSVWSKRQALTQCGREGEEQGSSPYIGHREETDSKRVETGAGSSLVIRIRQVTRKPET